MNGPILVPTDGSDPASAALAHALDIAADIDATVHVLYVANTSLPSLARLDTRVLDELEAEGEELVDAARATAEDSGVTAVDEVRRGDPEAVIREYVAERDIGLVVMGAHDRNGIGEYLFGTTTEAVLASCEAPVLTVRAGANEACSYPYERIVVPTDDSEYARAAAELAATIATRLDATIHLLFVADELPETIDPRSTGLSAELEENAQELLRDASSRLGHDDVVTAIEAGSVPHAITSYAETIEADLIAMGTHGWSGFNRYLVGSFTERVVRTATVPVLTTTVRED